MVKNKLVPLAIVWLGLTACAEVKQQSGSAADTNPYYHSADWISIPAGEFLMGSPDSDTEADASEKPQHKVSVDKAFKIGRHEVTFGEYAVFAQATNRGLPSDSGFTAADPKLLPVINVSWDDAVAYAKWLSEATGKNFRLPTEAEWEYAARAGSLTRRFWGDASVAACSYANVFDQRNAEAIRLRFSVPVIWAANHQCADDYLGTSPVGSFTANAWGLQDMLGNVWEWVQDCAHPDYAGAPTQAGQAWVGGNGGDCSKRGVRGGSWFVATKYVRSAERSWNNRSDRGSGIGFRLVQF